MSETFSQHRTAVVDYEKIINNSILLMHRISPPSKQIFEKTKSSNFLHALEGDKTFF